MLLEGGMVWVAKAEWGWWRAIEGVGRGGRMAGHGHNPIQKDHFCCHVEGWQSGLWETGREVLITIQVPRYDEMWGRECGYIFSSANSLLPGLPTLGCSLFKLEVVQGWNAFIMNHICLCNSCHSEWRLFSCRTVYLPLPPARHFLS